MRIESAAIGMDSARSYSSRTEHKQSVTFTLLNAQEKVKETDNENVKENQNLSNMSDNLVDIQNKYQEMLSKTNRISKNEVRDTFISLKHQCFQYLFQCVFGRKMGHTSTDGYITSGELTEAQYNRLTNPEQFFVSEMTVTATESYYFEESEQTTFDTTGIVKTADGREISFNLSLEMSRSFASYYESTYQEKAVVFLYITLHA